MAPAARNKPSVTTDMRSTEKESAAHMRKETGGFFSLPLEIRTIIYDLVSIEHVVRYWPSKGGMRTLLSLSRVSKQVHEDIVPYLYGKEKVRLCLPQNIPADVRDPFTLSCIRELHLTIHRPLSAREGFALISGYLRKCSALSKLTIDLFHIGSEQLVEIILALLSLPQLTAFQIPPRFSIYVHVLFYYVGVNRWSVRSTGAGSAISESEIQTHLPAPVVAANCSKLQEIKLKIFLDPAEFLKLIEVKMGGWHMVKARDLFDERGSDIHLSWEKLQPGVEEIPLHEMLRADAFRDPWTQQQANAWYRHALLP